MNTRPAIIKAYALGVITGAFFTAGLAFVAPAKADPSDVSPAVIKAGVSDEPFICRQLAAEPSVGELMAILTAVSTVEHMSAYDSGAVVGLAVSDGCPQYTNVLNRFIAIYGTSNTASA